jgi:hypothetical protein
MKNQEYTHNEWKFGAKLIQSHAQQTKSSHF